MTQLLTLLIVATQLLTQVQTNPNLPQSFRTYAEQIAITAITLAQAELAKLNLPQATTTPPAPQETPVVPPIVLGAVPPITNNEPQMPAPIDKSEIKVTHQVSHKFNADTKPRWEITYNVEVFDSEGKHVQGAPVAMRGTDMSFSRNTNINNLEEEIKVHGDLNKKTLNQNRDKIKGDLEDWHANFTYMTEVPGPKDITFTSGNLTKTVQITLD